jgi:chromosome segregation ATPase
VKDAADASGPSIDRLATALNDFREEINNGAEKDLRNTIAKHNAEKKELQERIQDLEAKLKDADSYIDFMARSMKASEGFVAKAKRLLELHQEYEKTYLNREERDEDMLTERDSTRSFCTMVGYLMSYFEEEVRKQERFHWPGYTIRPTKFRIEVLPQKLDAGNEVPGDLFEQGSKDLELFPADRGGV